MNNGNLQIDIRSYWHAGTGKGAGTDLDAITDKDHNGLPFISGKHIKGLLRQASICADTWGWFEQLELADLLEEGHAENITELLFGSQSQEQQRDATFPGMIMVGNAMLNKDEQHFLTGSKNTHLIPGLYHKLFSTAINEKGSAKKNSLRGIEVVVPLKLQAVISLEVTSLEPALREQQKALLQKNQTAKLLNLILPLVDHIGAWRTRGLGEVSIQFVAEEACA